MGLIYEPDIKRCSLYDRRVKGEHTRVLSEHSKVLDDHTTRFDRLETLLTQILARLPEKP